MENPFESSDDAMKHAFELLTQKLTPQVAQFEQSISVKLTSEQKLDANKPHIMVIKARLEKPIPTEIARTVKSIVSEMKSALDYPAYACRKNSVKTSQAGFPFTKFKRDFGSTKERASRNVNDDIYNAMAWFNPYNDEDGDKLLYQLNELRTEAIHRRIAPIAAHPTNLSISYEMNSDRIIALNVFDMVMPQTYKNPIYDLKNKEFILGHYDNRCTQVVLHEFKYILCLGKINGAPINPAGYLMHMWTRVETVLTVIKYEANRINLFDQPISPKAINSSN